MIYQRSYDKFINGGCTGNADFLYIKIHTATMLFPPKINAYWKQQCILYKRCLSTTVVQLICNTSFARLHERKLFTSALLRTAHQQVVGSNPTGSLKALTATIDFCRRFDSVCARSWAHSSVGRAKARKGVKVPCC